MGIRYSYQDAQPIATLTYATNIITKAKSNKVYKAFSPRIGVVYKPTNTTSVFASYANFFSVNASTDVFSAALALSIIDQFELGIKMIFLYRVLSANITFLQNYKQKFGTNCFVCSRWHYTK